MQITLQFEAPLFRLVAEDGRSILLQFDWDVPKAAGLSGFVPCPCGQTDGTIGCRHRTAREMIDDAHAFLVEHVSQADEDPDTLKRRTDEIL